MGYDISGSGTATILAKDIHGAAKALCVFNQTQDNGVDPKALSALKRRPTAKDLCSVLNWASEVFNFDVTSGGDIQISPVDDCFRRLEEHAGLFDALAPFIKAGSVFDFTGEDGARWIWRFDGAERCEEDGEVLFGEAARAYEPLTKILDILYPDGKMPPCDVDPEWSLDEMRRIVSQAGFGPHAGKAPLDIIAEVSDE